MSPGPEVVVAGGGVAAAATAVRLRGLGFGVRLLVRPGPVPRGVEALPRRALGLLDVLGEPGLVDDAGGVAVTGEGDEPTRVHVERTALARALLDAARARGVVVDEVRRLPPTSAVLPVAAAVVDATGRAAAWSRPLLTDGHDVAWQFEGPPQSDLALRVAGGEGWWAYRLGTPATTWAGVVVAAGQPAPDEAFTGLGLDPRVMVGRGRRAARVQRAEQAVVGRRIAVGDAALAHDPIAGAGVRFALASAVAAATTIATWDEDPGRRQLAADYYEDLVAGEYARHVEARAASSSFFSGPDLSRRPTTEVVRRDKSPGMVRFAGIVEQAPLAVDGLVRPDAAVRLPDATITRWLGSFDLLVLARLAAEPVPRIVLLARLQQEGLDVETARVIVAWALRHGLLTG